MIEFCLKASHEICEIDADTVNTITLWLISPGIFVNIHMEISRVVYIDSNIIIKRRSQKFDEN
jgi:hypothetical protein